MEVKSISVLELLHEKCRQDLRDKNMLRPAANQSDIVWQQMTLDHFQRLIATQELYCRAYGEYTNYDESKFQEFIQPHMNGKADHKLCEQLEQMYNEFERKLFVSCWYNSRDLSDVVFKVYAKGGSGIAVGTSVQELEKELSGKKEAHVWDGISDYSDGIQNIVCANIQYVPQNSLANEELFEPAQVYAPVFLKGYQFQMDSEFRVCIELRKPVNYIYNSDEKKKKRKQKTARAAECLICQGHRDRQTAEEMADVFNHADMMAFPNQEQRIQYSHCKIPVDIDRLIRYIAVKNDGYFLELEEQGTIKLFRNMFNLQMRRIQKDAANGFMIFEVMHKGGVYDF